MQQIESVHYEFKLRLVLLEEVQSAIVTAPSSWSLWATPRLAREQAVHRWFLFPHSFTGNLVESLIEEWGLGPDDCLLDPFVGSGTTLVTAKSTGIVSAGFDISPLAVFVANTKIATFTVEGVRRSWNLLLARIREYQDETAARDYPTFVREALPDGRLEVLDFISSCIDNLECMNSERAFFRLGLISVIRSLSQAVASGGWLRWRTGGAGPEAAIGLFEQRVTLMINDVVQRDSSVALSTVESDARIGDARSLPDSDMTYTAVICSPPYPNRHDYTRVFGVELMFAFLDVEQTRQLRQQSFESHPESRPQRPLSTGFQMPDSLVEIIGGLRQKRIRRMLDGYFLDMYLCLREIARVCKPGAMVALVLGNVRYDGEPILVDEYTALIGRQVGLSCREIRAVRWRGNSAQQMGRFGRKASRESVVIFQKS